MTQLKLTISEYGKEVRTYSDNDKQRFLEKSKEIINEHLSKYANQSTNEVKNISIHLATFG